MTGPATRRPTRAPFGTVMLVATVATAAACARSPASSPFAVADSLREEGLFRDAHPLYRALRDSLALAGDTANLWHAQLWWAQTLMRLGRSDSAAEALAQAFTLTGGDLGRVGWTRFMKCGLWNRTGRSDSALAECGRSLDAARAAHDGELEARVHFQLGTIQSRRGRFRLSVSETEQALALERQYGRSRYQMAGVLNSMGIEYAAAGRLSEADSMYAEGVRIARTFGSPWYAFHLASNLAYLRATSGDLRGGLDYMNESLRGAEQIADAEGMVYALNSLAEFYMKSGNRVAARAALERSLTLNQGAAVIHQVITLIDLGLLDADESRLDSAERRLRRGLELAGSSDFGLQGVQARVGLSRVALARGASLEGLRWAEEAVRIADSLQSPEVMIDALGARAAAREAARRSDAADGYLEGIALLESWRGRLALGDLGVGIADPRWGIYEGAIRTLLARNRTAEAFTVAERGRARLLLQVMAERDASRPASSPLVDLGRRLRQRSDELAGATDGAHRDSLAREVAALGDSLAVAGRALADDPSTAARYPLPAPLSAIRDGLVRPGRTLLTFFWGDSAVYGWSASETGVRAARLGQADSLEGQVAFLSAALAAPQGAVEWRIAAQRLFERLIAPLGPLAEDLLVIPDGPLARLPLEALMPPGQQPLGAAHRITYSPSASVSLALSRATNRPTDRAVLAVGNPTVARSQGDGDPEGARRAESALQPLPFAEEEARAVYELFKQQGGRLLVGRRATEQEWRAEEPGRYRFLHFAAHAIVDDRVPARTRVALAAGDLTLADIRGTQLAAQLVTLSACETALGQAVRGEGVIGLPHAFLAAGARAALVSLWRVRDRAAADFMREFYAELAKGTAPAEALRTVRRRWIADASDKSAPAAWAAFVLVGGW